MSQAEEMNHLGTLLDRLVRQIRLYGSDHQQSQTALQDLSAILSERLSNKSKIKIEVRRTTLTFEDQTILEITKSEGNYLYEAFVDGIRSFTFVEGIESSELLSLCQVLGRDQKSYEYQEDDTVTLIWKRDLPHVEYETVDAYASDRMALLQNLYSSSEESNEDERENSYLEKFVTKLIHPKPSSFGEAGPIGLSSSHHVEFQKDIQIPVPKDYFYWDSQIEENMAEYAKKELERDIRSDIATIFCEILESSEGAGFEELCQKYCNRIRDYFFKGELRTCNDWLRRLRAIQTYLGTTQSDIHETIDVCLLESFLPEQVDQLGPSFVQEAGVRPEDWTLFFQYLGPKILGFSGKLLGLFESETLHSQAVELFRGFHYRYSFHFKEFLQSPNPLLVRTGIRLLAPVLDEPSFQSEMSKLAIHPAAEIRKEVLLALRSKPEEMRVYFFKRALSDTDEEVRILALHELSQEPLSKLARPIAVRIASDKFLDTSLEEKRASLQALARSGASDAERFIREIVETNDMRPGQREIRVAAIFALSHFPTEENQIFLENLSKKALLGKEVREAAKNAMNRIHHHVVTQGASETR